ncbi:MAG: hypothetical protein HIU91_10790 [Acidobacteria bacterium]|nr:hypothetical protein [Acidobacteriota bacterium]
MDPSQYNHMQGMIASMMGIFLLIGLAFIAFFIFLFWRILDKAGLAGPLSLLILIWPIGLIIVTCILAFSDWKVIPAAQLYPGLQPYPPPPPSYPPPPPTA